MATIQQRVARLETMALGPTKIREVVSILVDRHSQVEIDAFLQLEGIPKADHVSLIINSIVIPAGQEEGPQLPIARLF